SEAKTPRRPVALDRKTATSRWAYVEDPNGIRIELFAHPPSWPRPRRTRIPQGPTRRTRRVIRRVGLPAEIRFGGERNLALDHGDIAWVIAATALVMIMTPALGFFYGGLVRRKNLVSTIAQCFAIFAVVSLVWALWGYTLALGPPFNAFIGRLDDFGLNNVGM